MEIVSLKIKKFLSISDVDLKPGAVTQIVGRNGQGKSSILKALHFAVKGGTDGSLVKFGEESAEVIVELADQTQIRRRLTSDGKQFLDVRKDGFTAPKPQAYLDALFTDSSFNPLELLNPKNRTDAILSSIDLRVTADTLAGELGIDKAKLPDLEYAQHGLKVIDQAHRYYYQRRAEANKDATEKKKRWETYRADLPAQVPATTKTRVEVHTEVESVSADLARAEQELGRVRRANEAHHQARARVEKYQAAVDDLDRQIKALEARKAEGTRFVENAKAEVPPQAQDDLPLLQRVNDLAIEREKIKGQFAAADHADAVAKQTQRVAEMEAEYQTAKAFAEALTEKVDSLAGPIKGKLMATADMPVPGLAYSDGTFSVEGVPVENMSTSSAMRLAIGVARKLAKKTKLVCLDGAEALDEDTYKALRAEIEGDGYTYFLTRVGEAFDSPNDTVVEMTKGAAVVR